MTITVKLKIVFGATESEVMFLWHHIGASLRQRHGGKLYEKLLLFYKRFMFIKTA